MMIYIFGTLGRFSYNGHFAPIANYLYGQKEALVWEKSLAGRQVRVFSCLLNIIISQAVPRNAYMAGVQ